MTSSGEASADTVEMDREAVLAKYLEERDKRLRPDGDDQYIEPTGQFTHLLEDPTSRSSSVSRCSTR
jgi:hypothetical protein